MTLPTILLAHRRFALKACFFSRELLRGNLIQHTLDEIGVRSVLLAIAGLFLMSGLAPKASADKAEAGENYFRRPPVCVECETTAQDDREIVVLEIGRPIERDLGGGQTHVYALKLAADQYIHVVLDRRNIELVVAIFDSSGAKLVQVDSLLGIREQLSVIAAGTGDFRLVVRAVDRTAPAGHYGLNLTASRAATENDRTQVAAQTLLDEGGQLRDENTRESFREAMNKLAEALRMFRAVKDASGETATLNDIATILNRTGNGQKALDFYGEALQLLRQIGDRQGEVYVLNRIGNVYNALSDNKSALDYLKEALSLSRNMGERKLEARALNNIGKSYSDLGEPEKALDYYGQALTLRRDIADVFGEAVTLNNFGKTYSDLGEQQKAIDHYAKALPILRALDDPIGEAKTLNNLGKVYADIGDAQKALDSFRRSLDLRRIVEDERGEATTLNNIANVYSKLGDAQKALDYFLQSLRLSRAVGYPEGEALVLNNIGEAYSILGDKQRALNYFEESLPLLRRIGHRQGLAVALLNIGDVYDDMGDKSKALQYYAQAQPIFRDIGDREGEATTLNNLGQTYLAQSEQKDAEESYLKALVLLRAINDRNGQSATLFNLAYLESRRGNLDEALTRVREAIDIVEGLRTNVARQELRASYFATKHHNFDLYIDLLMRLHQQRPSASLDAVALQVSELARARSLLELLNEASVDIRQGVDPELLQRERSLQKLLDERAESRVRLLNGLHTAEEAAAAAKEIDTLTTEYQELEAKIRQNSPRHRTLTQPEPLDRKSIQAQLDADTLLLEYSLGEERSYLWLVSPTEIKSYELPKRREIETAVRNYYEFLTGVTDARHKETLEAASRLSQMLLGPVSSMLREKHLVVVADGALQYLPFAALPEPTTSKQGATNVPFLIEHHEIVNLPSMSVLASVRRQVAGRKPPPKDIVVLADPVFSADDERVRNSGSQRKPDEGNSESVAALTGRRAAQESGALRDGNQLDRLPGTRKEADGIVALVPANRAKKALDFAANRELANSQELGQYRYVTFATHGLLDEIHPELTAIALSLVDEHGSPRDGYLRAHEIYNLNLSADVVVLSACRTALGKDVKGEGLIGLTRGFMYAGAPRVVASLWSVNDASTASLMVSFFRGMIKQGKRPADALRAAQIKMLRSERWKAPHYWAPFVLQGEWR